MKFVRNGEDLYLFPIEGAHWEALIVCVLPQSSSHVYSINKRLFYLWMHIYAGHAVAIYNICMLFFFSVHNKYVDLVAFLDRFTRFLHSRVILSKTVLSFFSGEVLRNSHSFPGLNTKITKSTIKVNSW